MQIPIQLQPASDRSLQEQLFDEFVSRIEDGRLQPGLRMPATRQLAAELGVSRNTVALAYERLTAEGFIEARPPLGTFVALQAPKPLPAAVPPAPPPTGTAPERVRPLFQGRMHALQPPRAAQGAGLALDFWVGRPDPRLFPAATWRRLVERSLAEDVRHGDGSYGDPAGLQRLRAAVAAHSGAARSVVCTADDVVVTNGIQEGINVVARLLLGPGTAVGVEHPGYAGAANVFASYGARVLPVAVDADGAVPGTLPPECRVVYLTPAHQYPTGAALSPGRRQAWLRWAAEREGYLIEDDYDGDFYYDSAPLPALKAQDGTGQVIYLGTLSKSLAPGLRLGYMIVPRELREAAATVKALLTNGSPWLVQASMAAFLQEGEFVHHLRRLRRHYAARRGALLAALARHFGAVQPAGAHAGMHVLWQAGGDLPDAATIEQRAREAGVGVYGLRRGNAWLGDDGEPERRWQHALLLGYAALTEDEIDTGIARVARAIGVA
ncbi:MAG: PLP-dependent aminotransferase family protein [Proteobacteria bacterium]|nr:PLP-dependent aminotransferase family protein [Pseudomonadota bacterium]